MAEPNQKIITRTIPIKNRIFVHELKTMMWSDQGIKTNYLSILPKEKVKILKTLFGFVSCVDYGDLGNGKISNEFEIVY